MTGIELPGDETSGEARIAEEESLSMTARVHGPRGGTSPDTCENVKPNLVSIVYAFSGRYHKLRMPPAVRGASLLEYGDSLCNQIVPCLEFKNVIAQRNTSGRQFHLVLSGGLNGFNESRYNSALHGIKA